MLMKSQAVESHPFNSDDLEYISTEITQFNTDRLYRLLHLREMRDGFPFETASGDFIYLKLDGLSAEDFLADPSLAIGSDEDCRTYEDEQDWRERQLEQEELSGFMPSNMFANHRFRQSFLVRNMLVAGQPAIVGGRSKTMKTSLMVDLAVSLGTGTPFLGHFKTCRAKPLILSGESGGFTIQETARRICRSRGVDLRKVDAMWGFRLPQLAKQDDLDDLRDTIAENGIKVVIIDPAYLCLLGGDTEGRQASNVFDMGPLLLGLSQVGQDTDSTIILCHHCRKNSHQELWSPPDLEELSMAGFAEWARQWLLLGRREAYQQGTGEHRLWLNVGGSAGHSGCYAVDVDEGTLGDDFTGRCWDVEVRPATDAKKEAKETRDRQKAAQAAEKDEDYKRRLLAALKSLTGGETQTALRATSGLNTQNFATGLRLLMGEGRAETCVIEKNGKEYEGYKWTGK